MTKTVVLASLTRSPSPIITPTRNDHPANRMSVTGLLKLLGGRKELTLGVVLCIVSLLLVLRNSSHDEEKVGEVRPSPTSSTKSEQSQSSLKKNRAKLRVGSRPVKRTQTSGRLLSQWNQVASISNGDELKEAQFRIAKEAADSLRGLELASFIESIFESGGGEAANWLARTGSVAIFAGSASDRKEALEWFSSLPNVGLQNTLASQAGRLIKKDEMEAFTQRISSPQIAAKFLQGYCLEHVKLSPYDCVYQFVEFKPDGADSTGLKLLMAALPITTDFQAIGSLLPRDTDRDSTEVRSEFLRRWAAYQPLHAISYIRENPESINQGQVVNVIKEWATASPEDAIAWVETSMPSNERDNCLIALSLQKFHTDPRISLRVATQITDEGARDAELKALFEKWSKLDSIAAEDAMKEYK